MSTERAAKCGACGPTLHWRKAHSDAKKLTEDVYLFDDNTLVHACKTIPNWYKVMLLREHDDGPRYWCEECGYVVDDGVAMAVRLYEVPIS